MKGGVAASTRHSVIWDKNGTWTWQRPLPITNYILYIRFFWVQLHLGLLLVFFLAIVPLIRSFWRLEAPS